MLSVNDHQLKKEAILARVTGNGWFGLSRKGLPTYTFSKRISSGGGNV
jgi:hypothetical protein